MKWVLIGGGNGSRNLGDEAMWLAAARVLREEYPTAEIVTDGSAGWVPSLRDVSVLPYVSHALRRGKVLPAGLRAGLWGDTLERVISRPRRDTYAAVEASRQLSASKGLVRWWQDEIESASGLVFCGSGGINDHYASHAITGWGLLTEFAVLAGRPVGFIGQGVGPLDVSRNRAGAERMLSRADLITVRDQRSAQLLSSMRSVRTEVETTADWAYLLTPDTEDMAAARAFHSEELGGEQFVAVSLHRRPASNRSDLRALGDLLGQAAAQAAAKGMRVVFVPTMRGHLGADDIVTAKRLIRQLDDVQRKNIVLLERPSTVGFIRSVLGESAGVIATRYHAVVFGLAEGVPVIPVAHDPYYVQKLRGAMEWAGVAIDPLHLSDVSWQDIDLVDALRSLPVVTQPGREVADISRSFRKFISDAEGR